MFGKGRTVHLESTPNITLPVAACKHIFSKGSIPVACLVGSQATLKNLHQLIFPRKRFHKQALDGLLSALQDQCHEVASILSLALDDMGCDILTLSEDRPSVVLSADVQSLGIPSIEGVLFTFGGRVLNMETEKERYMPGKGGTLYLKPPFLFDMHLVSSLALFLQHSVKPNCHLLFLPLPGDNGTIVPVICQNCDLEKGSVLTFDWSNFLNNPYLEGLTSCGPDSNSMSQISLAGSSNTILQASQPSASQNDLMTLPSCFVPPELVSEELLDVGAVRSAENWLSNHTNAKIAHEKNSDILMPILKVMVMARSNQTGKVILLVEINCSCVNNS